MANEQLAEDELPDGHRPTDLGNARRFIELAKGKVRYVESWARWLVYDIDAGVWRTDPTGARVKEMAGIVSHELLVLAHREAKSADRKELLKLATRLESAAGVKNMLDLAKGLPGVLVSQDDLDADPWLLNCSNGTLNLHTGELQPHEPKDLITKSTRVRYDPAAPRGRFDAFLVSIMPDADERAYLLRVLGSAVAGAIREHALHIWIGNGANGKTTLMRSVAGALGDYGVEASAHLLTESRYDSHDTKFADLFRARLAYASETSSSARLHEERVKALTGGDRVKARRMREDYWSFDPTHTLFLLTNHLPDIRGREYAIWRRIHVLLFRVSFNEGEIDLALSDRLTEERDGVLAAVVEGCMQWQRGGLCPPASVRDANAAYRRDQDRAGRFIADCGLVVDSSDHKAWMPSRDLVNLHERWCDENGIRHDSQWLDTTARLRDLGASRGRQGNVRGWAFLRIEPG